MLSLIADFSRLTISSAGFSSAVQFQRHPPSEGPLGVVLVVRLMEACSKRYLWIRLAPECRQAIGFFMPTAAAAAVLIKPKSRDAAFSRLRRCVAVRYS